MKHSYIKSANYFVLTFNIKKVNSVLFIMIIIRII